MTSHPIVDDAAMNGGEDEVMVEQAPPSSDALPPIVRSAESDEATVLAAPPLSDVSALADQGHAGAASNGVPAEAMPASAAPDVATRYVGVEKLIFVDGYSSSNAAATGQERLTSWSTLRRQLTGRGFGERDLIDYSYTGGHWTGDQWRPNSYRGDDTKQPLDISADHLRSVIRDLKGRGHRVGVVGFGLGGAVAYHAIQRPLSTLEQLARPDALVAIASPLQGLDVRVRQGVCGRAMLTFGVAGGVITGGLSGAMADGRVPALLCPTGAAMDQLDALYHDAGRRATRDNFVRVRARELGARIMTIGSQNDCLYHLALCAEFLQGSGSDERSTALVDGVDHARLYANPVRYSGWEQMEKIHRDLLYHEPAMADVARFVGN